MASDSRIAFQGEHTQIDLLRHGEHVLGKSICGVKDPALSQVGWSQLVKQTTGLIEKGTEWDICVSSPRIRCSNFSAHLVGDLKIELIIDEGFSEVDFGRWEGLTSTEIEKGFPGEWQQWIDNPEQIAPHGGEQYGHFIRRICQAWNQLIERFRGKRILLLSHSGVMRAILANVLNLDATALFRFNIPLACHSRVSAYHMKGKPDWFQLDQHNAAHF